MFSERFLILEDEHSDGVYTLHGYPNATLKLSKIKDGADIFELHKPGLNDSVNGVSLESVKFPNYFIYADIDDGVHLQLIGNNEGTVYTITTNVICLF